MTKEEKGKKILCCLKAIADRLLNITAPKIPSAIIAAYVLASHNLVADGNSFTGNAVVFNGNQFTGNNAVIASSGCVSGIIGNSLIVTGDFSESVFNSWVLSADNLVNS